MVLDLPIPTSKHFLYLENWKQSYSFIVNLSIVLPVDIKYPLTNNRTIIIMAALSTNMNPECS